MAKIQYTARRGARYTYRRRLCLPGGSSALVTVALQTADPAAARARAAALSARFEAIKARMNMGYLEGKALTATQMSAVYHAELEAELGRAIGELYTADNVAAAAYDSRLQHEAWRLTQRPGSSSEIGGEEVFALRHAGLSEGDIEWVRMLADRLCHPAAVANGDVEKVLGELGQAASPIAVAMARTSMVRARAAARGRAADFLDPRVQGAEDQAAAMLTMPFDTSTTSFQVPAPPARVPSPPAPTVQGPFAARDERRFSTVIDDVVATLRREGQWCGDAGQQRRILTTFAWITGDKRLCDYTHLDADIFRRGLEALPSAFRFGSATDGPLARPFADVVADLDPASGNGRRTAKTVNRDLSTMSTVAKHLAKTAWRPAIPNTLVLDFASLTIRASRRTEAQDTRPPWTRPHMTCLFDTPLFTGGGGRLRRLRKSNEPHVYHDAAYFAPLLWYYSHACREEICGLRADEVDVDHDVPHFKIQDNDVRGRDGDLAGEKRAARKRALPLHDELIRLGFTDYVRAIRAEGHVALFPELYGNAQKRGGGQFYNVAWRHMIDLLATQMPLPIASNGKGADIHSIRALGSSFYEVDGVNEILRADVMGHARTGTNAKHYSKRMQTEGLDVVLAERKTFIARYVPVVTGHLIPHTIRMLLLEHRSRLGSGISRSGRSDRGVRRR